MATFVLYLRFFLRKGKSELCTLLLLHVPPGFISVFADLKHSQKSFQDLRWAGINKSFLLRHVFISSSSSLPESALPKVMRSATSSTRLSNPTSAPGHLVHLEFVCQVPPRAKAIPWQCHKECRSTYHYHGLVDLAQVQSYILEFISQVDAYFCLFR